VIFVSLNNFQTKSVRNASSLLRFKGRYVNDKLIHDSAQEFLFRNNGNTSALVEKLLCDDFMKRQASNPEIVQ